MNIIIQFIGVTVFFLKYFGDKGTFTILHNKLLIIDTTTTVYSNSSSSNTIIVSGTYNKQLHLFYSRLAYFIIFWMKRVFLPNNQVIHCKEKIKGILWKGNEQIGIPAYPNQATRFCYCYWHNYRSGKMVLKLWMKTPRPRHGCMW